MKKEDTFCALCIMVRYTILDSATTEYSDHKKNELKIEKCGRISRSNKTIMSVRATKQIQ